MARADFVAPFLPPERRRELESRVGQLLPATDEKICQFLDLAEEAIDLFRKLTLPAYAEKELRERRLERLSRAAREFKKAIDALSTDTIDFLEFA